MTDSSGNDSQTPRMVGCDAWRAAGLRERYTYGRTDGIAGQWRRFTACMGDIPGREGDAAYGVMLPVAGLDGFEYLTGVEIGADVALADGFSETRVPAARYAVFEHRGHVANIRESWTAVWNRWLAEAGCDVLDQPVLFERYGEDFDADTGEGVVGLWVPVRTERS